MFVYNVNLLSTTINILFIYSLKYIIMGVRHMEAPNQMWVSEWLVTYTFIVYQVELISTS